MFKKRKDLSDPHEIKTLEEEMVLNSLNVLFKRGIKGTYLYAHDPLLRKTLVSMFKQHKRQNKRLWLKTNHNLFLLILIQINCYIFKLDLILQATLQSMFP